jgi:hypothetical protein
MTTAITAVAVVAVGRGEVSNNDYSPISNKKISMFSWVCFGNSYMLLQMRSIVV